MPKSKSDLDVTRRSKSRTKKMQVASAVRIQAAMRRSLAKKQAKKKRRSNPPRRRKSHMSRTTIGK